MPFFFSYSCFVCGFLSLGGFVYLEVFGFVCGLFFVVWLAGLGFWLGLVFLPHSH